MLPEERVFCISAPPSTPDVAFKSYLVSFFREDGEDQETWDIFWQKSAVLHGEMSGSQATSGHFRVMAVYLSFVVESLISLLYVTGTQQAFLSGMIYTNVKRSSNSW